MKVYVFQESDSVFVAMLEDGTRLFEHHAAGMVRDPQSEALAVRHAVKLMLQDDAASCKFIWVPDPSVHPVLQRLLAAEVDDAEPEPQDTRSCSVCVHAVVCEGYAVSARLGFEVRECQHFIELPSENLYE